MENVFIMREGCHVDMTGVCGIAKNSDVEHTWLVGVNLLRHCQEMY